MDNENTVPQPEPQAEPQAELQPGEAQPGAEEAAAPAAVAEAAFDPVKELDDCVNRVLNHMEHNFIFRKLGVAYDYVSPPGDFPRSSLPRPNEARDGNPNPYGIGTGMADCISSTGILLDTYLTRLELGLSGADESRIMDRLVAGIIRLGTAGPKTRFVGGLAADGRSYYPECQRHQITWYAHGLLRAHETPALSPESQGKLADICGKWLRGLSEQDWDLPELSASDEALQWEYTIRFLHILAVGMQVHEKETWAEARKQFCGRDGFAIRPELPQEVSDPGALLSLQIALYDLCRFEEDADLLSRFNLLRRKIGYRLKESLAKFREFEPTEPVAEAKLDWRTDLKDAKGTAAELQEAAYSAWPRLRREAETINASGQAALAIILSQDRDLIDGQSETIAALSREAQWTEIWSIIPLRAIALAHALGREMELWGPLPVAEANPEEIEAIGTCFTCDVSDESLFAYAIPEPEARRRNPLFPKSVLRSEQGDDNRKGGRRSGSRSGSRSSGNRRRSSSSGNRSQNRSNNNSDANNNKSDSGSNDSKSENKSNSGGSSNNRRGRRRRGRRRRPGGNSSGSKQGNSNQGGGSQDNSGDGGKSGN